MVSCFKLELIFTHTQNTTGTPKFTRFDAVNKRYGKQWNLADNSNRSGAKKLFELPKILFYTTQRLYFII